MVNRRTILPRRLVDWLASLVFICGIPMEYWFEMTYVIPHFYSNGSFWYYWHTLLLFAIVANIFLSYFYAVMIDTTIYGRFISSKDDTRICAECETIVPVRSWHCKICEICVLKRDHHCTFTSCCIGYFNYRYYYLVIFYVFLASVYAIYLNTIYIYQTWAGFNYHILIILVIPLFVFMFGNISVHLNTIAEFIPFFIMIYTGGFLCFQTTLIVKGRVSFERIHKINKYDVGWRNNLIQVFGERWYIAWISPMIPSKLPGDGIEFPSSDIAKTKHI